MWPLGNKEDYKAPGCRKIGDIGMKRTEYWNFNMTDYAGRTRTWVRNGTALHGK